MSTARWDGIHEWGVEIAIKGVDVSPANANPNHLAFY